jgi:hypothetical protein
MMNLYDGGEEGVIGRERWAEERVDDVMREGLLGKIRASARPHVAIQEMVLYMTR